MKSSHKTQHQTTKACSKPSDASATTVRINKALADAGVCSRRKAEDYIVAGAVCVNGNCITDLAFKVGPEDSISVHGREIVRTQARSYLLMHKPIHTICTADDPDQRETIFSLLPAPWNTKRLFSVGRLDYFSEGLLLLTDDGELAQRLAHPRYHLPKIYHVFVRESVLPLHLDQMQSGMTLAEGETLAPVSVRLVTQNQLQNATCMEMTLHQGINRQIRRMCRDLNLTILKLVRIAQGPIHLRELPVGAVRPLREEEVLSLRKATNMI